jgi:hypothetical protein
VTRVVTLSNPNTNGEPWLIVGQPYKVVFPVPKDNDDESGLRAIDRATHDPSVGHQIGFQVTAPRPGLPVDPPMRFCRDVQPILKTRCSSPQCHGSPTEANKGLPGPAAGLVLETSIGVLFTAIGRVSVEANTGPRAGYSVPPGRVFGFDMPLVAPKNPGNSWLMYKLLLALPQDPGDPLTQPRCGAPATDPGIAPLPALLPTTVFTELSNDERTRLGDHMRGNPMPYPPTPGNPENRSENLTFDELERVRSWITQGAIVEDCGACAQ